MGVGERVEFMVRPGVPMGHVTGVPYRCALGVAEALGARLRWPFAVVSATGEPVAGVRARAGYDDEGVFVACEVAPLGEEGLDAAALERAAPRGRRTSPPGGRPRARSRPCWATTLTSFSAWARGSRCCAAGA